jgi:hypothetical protein
MHKEIFWINLDFMEGRLVSQQKTNSKNISKQSIAGHFVLIRVIQKAGFM